jgi:hypothetical protein
LRRFSLAVTRLTSRLAIAATVVVLLPAITFAAQAISVRFDPDKPNEKSAAIWLGYLIARVAYHDKHNLPIPPSGEIIPSFDEELDARKAATQIYRELKEKDAKLKDPYWETLSEVDRRGFLAAYVWTFLRRQQWPAVARPANLAAFEAWKNQALPKHKPQTYGWLEAGKP